MNIDRRLGSVGVGMSIFKVKEWWTTTCGSGEEFDVGGMVERLAGLQGDLAPLGRPRGGSGPSDAPDSAPP